MLHDQYSDKSFKVFAEKIRSFTPETREFLKTAEINYDEEESLPDTSFAWPELRKLAMHNPHATALSLIYAHDENLPKSVTDRLEKAANLYEVTVEAITEKTAEVIENPEDFLIPQQHFGKISSKDHVKEASEFFSNNYKKMNLETRATAAAALVKKAREHNCRISPSYYRHAGLTQTNSKILGEWLEVRANLTEDSKVKEAYTKIASHVNDKNKFNKATRAELIKLADTISILDEKANLVRRYDITLPDPLLSVFNTSKVAEETLSFGGKNIPVEELMAHDPQTYGDVLGGDIVGEIMSDGKLNEGKLLDVLRTLPADLQINLVKTLGL